MGLDMYLYLVKSDYRGGCNYPDEFAKFQIDIEKHNFKSMSVKTKCQVGYWRKANAIHNWIVQNCANGVDECQEIYLNEEKLGQLLDACQRVLDKPSLAPELLPTKSGFLFGDTNYDEYYKYDLEYTIHLIKEIQEFMKNADTSKVDYYVVYEASW